MGDINKINKAIGEYFTAMKSGNYTREQVIKWLEDGLIPGVQLGMPTTKYTPLIFAAEYGRLDVVVLMKLAAEALKLSKENAKKLRLTLDDETVHYTPLIAAAKGGHTNIVNYLLEQGVDVNQKTHYNTALMVAAEENQLEVAKKLIAAGANLNKGTKKYTPLLLAVKKRHPEMVRLLLEAGANIKVKTEEMLEAAVWNNQPNILKLLLDAGARITGKGQKSSYDRLMRYAVQNTSIKSIKLLQSVGATLDESLDLCRLYGCQYSNKTSDKAYKVAKILIQAGADVNRVDDSGRTPLIYVARIGDIKNAQLLIESGADVNQHGSDCTALIEAAQCGHKKFVRFLTSAGARPDAEDDGASLISYIQMQDIDTVKQLLVDGADVNARKDRNTPLLEAVKGQNAEIVKMLVRYGADVNLTPSKSDLTPVSVAASMKSLPILQCLVEHGADVNMRVTAFGPGVFWWAYPLEAAAGRGLLNNMKYLLAHGAQFDTVKKGMMRYAIEGGNSRIVKFLFDAGIKVNECEVAGYSPLHLAARVGNLKITEMLLKAGADKNRIWGKQSPLDEAVCGEHKDVANLLRKVGGFSAKKATSLNEQLVDSIIGKESFSVRAHTSLGFTHTQYFPCPHGTAAELMGQFKTRKEGGLPKRMGKWNGCTLEEMQKQLDAGASPNAYNGLTTALAAAITLGRVDLTTCLLRAGADPNIVGRREFGDTPLTVAARGGKEEIVNLLLDAGADPNVSPKDGYTPIIHAIFGNKVHIVKILLAAGANIQVVLQDIYPLTAAVACANPEIVKMLLAAGADPHREVGGKTALDVALENENAEIAELLRRAGSDQATDRS